LAFWCEFERSQGAKNTQKESSSPCKKNNILNQIQPKNESQPTKALKVNIFFIIGQHKH